MQRDDAEAVARLCAALGATVTAAEAESRIAALSGLATQGLYVAELAAQGVLGWMHVQERPSLLTPSSAELTALVVDPRAREQGLGRGLVRQAEVWAGARGCVRLCLRSGATRVDAHRFYVALGYVQSSSSYKFERSLA